MQGPCGLVKMAETVVIMAGRLSGLGLSSAVMLYVMATFTQRRQETREVSRDSDGYDSIKSGSKRLSQL